MDGRTAVGNLATEDLVLMAVNCGFDTGIDPGRLPQVVEFAEAELQRPLGGRSSAWLPRQREKTGPPPRSPRIT